MIRGLLSYHPLPMIPGHEAVGEIVEVGSNVKDFNVGDRVIWWFSLGAFAEYISINPASVVMVKVPESISDEEAAILELTGAASRAVKAVPVREGKVLIIGLGPSGLIMSQLAKISGASTVVGWDLYGMRRKKGLGLGCDYSFNNHTKDIVENTKETIGEVDIVIDAFGDDVLPEKPGLYNAMSVLKEGGKIISYGHPVKGRVFNPVYLQKKGLSILPTTGTLKSVRGYIEKAIREIQDGRLKIAPLISGHVSLKDLPDGIKMVEEHPEENLKIIVDV